MAGWRACGASLRSALGGDERPHAAPRFDDAGAFELAVHTRDGIGVDFEIHGELPHGRELLARLPSDDRLALFLHFYLDLPLEEVGAVLGVSAAGAKTRVYRAAKKLRPDLEMS